MLSKFKPIITSYVDDLAPRLLHGRRIRRAQAQERELKVLPALCDSRKKAIDIGANRGLYVNSLVGLVRSVVAFEPLPNLCARLKKLYGRRIEIESVALSDAEGMAELRLPYGNYSWATMAPTNSLSLTDASKKIVIVQVNTRPLDSYNFSDVGFIKIDVEGHEEAVIAGGQATLAREMPNLIIETEERHNPGSVLRIENMLRSIGYQCFYLYDDLVHPFTDFDLARDQPITNISETGKEGRYINNFIFVPRERAERTRREMVGLIAQRRD